MSLRNRLKSLEKDQRQQRQLKLAELPQGVYTPKWIREQEGIIDPRSEAIERELGLGTHGAAGVHTHPDSSCETCLRRKPKTDTVGGRES